MPSIRDVILGMKPKAPDDEMQRDFVNALIGAGQGASFEFGDEIYGAGGALQSMMYGVDPIQGYKGARDEARARIRQAETESPNAYMAGNITGSALTPVPGLGMIGAGKAALTAGSAAAKVVGNQSVKDLSREALKRIALSTALGGTRAAGKSEADNLKDFAEDVLMGGAESADTMPAPALIPDVPRRNVGDVIDFKKMREKLKKEKIETPSYGKPTGNLGKPSKEMMDENNVRAMREAGLSEKIRREPIVATLSVGDDIYTPEKALERVSRHINPTVKEHEPSRQLVSKIEKEGADEPYVGRDFSDAIALRDERQYDLIQPIPVPPSKVGDLKGILGKGVLTGESDPFGWTDATYGVSKALLEREKGKPLKIYTRSDLIAHDDYVERLGKNHEVNIVFSTPNDQIGRMIEPGAPSLARRITAANKLAESGVSVKLHYQIFDNKKLPDSWAQFQPSSELEVLRILRERGLDPKVKVQIESTPIKDKNLKDMLKVLGLEMNPRMEAKERALDKARGRKKKKDEE